MPKLTLTKALATGVLKPDLPTIVLLDSIKQKDVWVSDERKAADDPAAVYLVVEVGGDDAAADALRDLGRPVVALQHGWYSYAVSPDFNAAKTFRLSAFEWGKTVYGGRRPHLRHRIAAYGATVYGYRRLGPDRFVAHVEIDRNVVVHSASYAPNLDVYRRTPLLADLHVELDPSTGAVGLSDDQTETAVIPTRAWLDRAFAMTLDGYRRAVRRPRGEGRG